MHCSLKTEDVAACGAVLSTNVSNSCERINYTESLVAASVLALSDSSCVTGNQRLRRGIQGLQLFTRFS